MGNTLLINVPSLNQPQQVTLAKRELSLENRAMPGSFMNEVMRDNILLTLFYLRGEAVTATPDWEAVRKAFTYNFELKPGETYAFQKASLPEFNGTITKTVAVNFGGQDGYKSDGYLMGDGVCHLASLFYWAALDAGLNAVAPTNHNFMPIPDIPREYGVAIYSMPNSPQANAQQNLYIQNNTGGNIRFDISYDGKEIRVKVFKIPTEASNATQEFI